MCLLREQPIKTAVERHAGNDGHQDRRHRSDDGEQGDDTHMQSRRRAPATPCLHDAPHLACDEQGEQQDRDGIGGEKRDHDLVRRRNRRQAGEHDERHQGRQQAQARRRPGRAIAQTIPAPALPQQLPIRRLRLGRHWSSTNLVQNGNSRKYARTPPVSGLMLLYQQCCRITTIQGRVIASVADRHQPLKSASRCERPEYPSRGFSYAKCCD